MLGGRLARVSSPRNVVSSTLVQSSRPRPSDGHSTQSPAQQAHTSHRADLTDRHRLRQSAGRVQMQAGTSGFAFGRSSNLRSLRDPWPGHYRSRQRLRTPNPSCQVHLDLLFASLAETERPVFLNLPPTSTRLVPLSRCRSRVPHPYPSPPPQARLGSWIPSISRLLCGWVL
jgi:hypothetical protein